METSDIHADRRLPVTLLTGFLGAGKTTVLNGLLRSPGQDRIAVIVNEFGEAGLDHDLIEAVDEEIVLMRSGCLCCSVRGDLARVVVDLLNRRSEGHLAFERVVIETTGLADPGPIIQTLQVTPDLARLTRMDGIVTVADAAAGPGTLDQQFEAVSQVAMADLVILSKADLVSDAEATDFEQRINALNPTACVLRATRGDLPANSLWGLSAVRKGAGVVPASAWLAPAAAPVVDPFANLSGMASRSPAKSGISPHDSRIGSASIVLDAPIPDTVFDLWLDTLIALRGPDLLRVKGVVHIEGVPDPFVFHGVQHVFDMPVPIKDWPVDDHQSRIVVIARDLSRPELQRSLDMLRARQPQSNQPAETSGGRVQFHQDIQNVLGASASPER
ncbi:CobW family GTP-binding protein [Pseudooceanicola algae]|uniref:P-loop guanosine triphosphatase YjiA n=1 Tax=Pseudooceanicola algae TaxID=1537215 RepID=A0A418SBL6_9RHOB|nr:GTP-binding protein [Pseudooceanicola algae]QPM92481.1 P-loop guanosine triphosphatase YjiA [Pseudooceanicola algae]